MPCHVIFSDDQFNSGQQRTLLQRPSTTTRSGNKNRVLGASMGDCYIFISVKCTYFHHSYDSRTHPTLKSIFARILSLRYLCTFMHFAVSCLSSFGFSTGFCVHTWKFRSKGHNTNLSRHKPLKELRLRRRCLHPAHDQACVVAVLREMLSPRNLNSFERVGILKVWEWAFGCKTQLVTIQFAMPEGLRKRWLASIFMYRGCGIPANGGLFGCPSRNSHGQSVHAICTLPSIK